MGRYGALVVLALVLLALTACGRNLTNPDGWSGAVVVEGVVYAGTGEGQLVALDRQTGESLWDFNLLGDEGARAVYGTPVLSGGTMYVGGYDGFLYVFDVGGSTDPLNWAEPVLLDSKEVKTPLEEEPEPIVGGPSVVDEDCSDASGGVPCQIVMVGSSDNSVYTFEVIVRERGQGLHPGAAQIRNRRQGVVDARGVQRRGLLRLPRPQGLRALDHQRKGALGVRDRGRRRGLACRGRRARLRWFLRLHFLRSQRSDRRGRSGASPMPPTGTGEERSPTRTRSSRPLWTVACTRWSSAPAGFGGPSGPKTASSVPLHSCGTWSWSARTTGRYT